MKVAVIGAGIAGLLAVKYSKQAGLETTCFEKSSRIGGTWIYSDEIGQHSSMYQNLLSNVPKEIMGFQDYPFTGPDKSFVTHTDVLEFIERYEKDFQLKQYIKFEHLVTLVRPIDDGKWSVEVKDLKTHINSVEIFDGIFVCNGHFSLPNFPKLPGIENFKGKMMHSHDYRRPEHLKDQRVLVIGAGPSGRDISLDLSSTAKNVMISHHLSSQLKEDAYPENVQQKPDVKRILENADVVFVDGSQEIFDCILFCTGYKYNFPFLSPECKIEVDDNHISTLYKHLVNVHYPTMFIVGVPYFTIITLLLDLQVRFCLQFLTGKRQLPSKGDMLREVLKDVEERKSKSLKKRKMHFLAKDQVRPYYQELAQLADIEPIKPVLIDIFEKSVANDFKIYRKFVYRVIDDHTFEEYLKE